MRRYLSLVIAIVCPVLLLAQPAGRSAPIFRFETDEFWLNLHHFLYVLGRAERHLPDATREAVIQAPVDAERGMSTLSEKDRTTWRAAVAYYAAGPSAKDAVFESTLAGVARALSDVDSAVSLSAVNMDSTWRAVLERAAPIYRKAWWPAHRAANQTWLSTVQPLVDRYGADILAFITKAYGMEWPSSGYPVHLSGYSNWAGAYSTRGTLLVISGLDTASRGALGLETVFHEGMHQWDEAVIGLLRDQARALGVRVPPNLSHGMIFFTAGEAVRRVIVGHVPVADHGIWERGFQQIRAALIDHWKPYLDGRGTREEAITAVLRRLTSRERRE